MKLFKSFYAVIGLITLSILTFENAEARTNKSSRDDIQYRQSGTESVYSSSTSRSSIIGLGFSTVQNAVPGSTTAALTATFDLTRVDTIQGFFTIPSTSPFSIGGAALYKRTIAQSRGAGFHIGGGLGMADVATNFGSAFALNFSAIVGFHFELPGIPQVAVHLDGGPTFNLYTTSPSTVTNFQIAALSPALGASILYLF